ncbi:MAG: NADP-dependent phosphogluconate dehydrogenase [Chloroflexi bacterium]|nr:NADP-dependent phosphogluconate dehydrogenase [Chloroflexota bacterium]
MLASQFTTLQEPEDALTFEISLPPAEIVQGVLRAIAPGGALLGILGLGVMGRSLAHNFARHGYRPVGYDLNPEPLHAAGIPTAASLEDLLHQLEPPRTLFLMVPAGAPVDAAIASLRPGLQKGDVIIDGGNSYFSDTERRYQELAAAGIHFIGLGVSGGENGALWGPSLMPGGSIEAWQRVGPMFAAIAARTPDGELSVGWMGAGGAGHYVKMVHNGIEYGDMQLIAEVYDLLHRGAGLSNQELSQVFADWNRRELHSYLIEITVQILAREDEETHRPLLDLILDEAGQKGTGMWTAQNSLDLGVAIPTINSAVESRILSARKAERLEAARVFGGAQAYHGDRQQLIAGAEKALYASKVTAYAQGLQLLRTASQQYAWNVDLAEVVRVWKAGCIIRASLLNDIAAAYTASPDLPNLLLDEAFSTAVRSRQSAWRQVVQTAVGLGIPMLATGASLAYFDAYRSAVLPTNLTQAQRDYFGAHTYRRVDKEGVFHTQW